MSLLWLSDIRLKFSIKLNVIKLIKKLMNFLGLFILRFFIEFIIYVNCCSKFKLIVKKIKT